MLFLIGTAGEALLLQQQVGEGFLIAGHDFAHDEEVALVFRFVFEHILELGEATSVQSGFETWYAAEAPTAVGDGLNQLVFAFTLGDLSVTVPVRPDGRISVPLLQDVVAAQKTPSQLAKDIKTGLSEFVKEPEVTVMVTDFTGTYSEQVRVIGEAAKPQAIPYRARMSVLDVMIAAGGLTEFAAGNRSLIVRQHDGQTEQNSRRSGQPVEGWRYQRERSGHAGGHRRHPAELVLSLGLLPPVFWPAVAAMRKGET